MFFLKFEIQKHNKTLKCSNVIDLNMFTSETFGCNWLIELSRNKISAEFSTQDGAVMLRLTYSDLKEIKLDNYKLICLVRSKLNDQSIFKLKLDDDDERKRYTIVRHPEREEWVNEVKKNGYELKFVSDELKNDKEIVLVAVTEYGVALEYASDTLRNDREVVLAAVRQDGDALVHASDELKNDREIVLAAVHQNGWALQYASEELRNDKEIVLAAN